MVTADGSALLRLLSNRARRKVREKYATKGLVGETFLRFTRFSDYAVNQGLSNEILEATRAKETADRLLRGTWKVAHRSPVRVVYESEGLPPVEFAIEGKRWILTTKLSDFLPLPTEK
ncbi:MAG: hypothetical protein AAB074_11925 [Planctomycetota bacterium]